MRERKLAARVGFDMDGVMSDFTREFTGLAHYLRLIEAPWTTEHQPKWEFDFDDDKVWNQVRRTPNWWMTLKPLVTTSEIRLLNELIAKHRVYFITSRTQTGASGFNATTQTSLWLQAIGVNIGQAFVVATKSGRKGELCNALDIEAFLDDYPKNLHELSEKGVIAYARNWRYNRDWAGPRATGILDFANQEGLI